MDQRARGSRAGHALRVDLGVMSSNLVQSNLMCNHTVRSEQRKRM